jgi:4,5-DOPA dioxygenase extradiol
MMPAFFIAHGAPLLAIESNAYTHVLHDLANQLPRPSAILIFSAHWVSHTQRIGAAEQFHTIHDFAGFPQELYEIQYPAKGDVGLAAEIQQMLQDQGIACQIDSKRGLDHGSWVVLRLLYPNADVPVVAMSVNPNLAPQEQYRIGKSLAALRSNGVLMIGSGGTVHNLGALQWREDTIDTWAVEFDDWLADTLTNWDLESLFQYYDRAPHAKLAVPPYGNEHFIPLLYAMGAADAERSSTLVHRSYRYGSLSQSVWQFG